MNDLQRSEFAITEVIKKINSLLLSPKSALISIFLILAACLVSVVVPQVNNVKPAYYLTLAKTSPATDYWANLLQLNHVYTSTWFFALILFLVLVLLFSIVRQYQKARAVYTGGDVNLFFPPQVEFELESDLLLPLKKSLQKMGFRMEEQDVGEGFSLSFRKNRLSLWGTFLFHIGLLLLVMASLFNFAFQKWGFAQVIEGDTFSGRQEDFLSLDKGMFAGGLNVNAEVYLERFRHTYWDTGELREVAGEVVIHPHEGLPWKTVITKAAPLFIQAIRLYQSGYFGYAIKIDLLRDNRVMPGYFLLDMASRGKPLTGRSDFPTTGYDMDMKFYPDMKGGGMYPVDPLLSIIFFKGERELDRKTLRPGDEFFVEDQRFRFAEVRNWSGFIFSENRFMPLIYIGYIIVSAGLMLALVFPFQEIVVVALPLSEGRYRMQASIRSRMGREQLRSDLMAFINREVSGHAEKS